MAGLHGQISLDYRDALTGVRAFRAELKDLAKLSTDFTLGGSGPGGARGAARNVGGGIKRQLNDTTKAAKAALAQQKRDAADWAREISATHQRAGVSVNRFGDVVKKMTSEERRSLQQQKQDGASWAREIDKTYNRSGLTINRFGEEVRTVTGYLGELTREQRQALTAQKNEADSWAREIEADMKRAGAAVDRYGDNIDKAKIDAAKSAKASAARSELARGVGNAASVAGVGILASLGAATKVSVEFGQSMRNVNSIAQLSEERFAALKNSVAEIARDPQVLQGPRGLSEALYDIYSSGFEGAQALEVLREAAQGATAGQTDAATSGKVLMATLNSGIPGVKSAAEAMDVLFKTVDRGVVSFPELAGSLGAILPTASKAGVTLQQVGAAVALMTKSGQSASESTNDLLNLLNKVANPGKAAAEQFDKLGVAYGFTALQAKGLPGVLKEIQEKTGGNADSIKKLLPDMQAQRAALSLLKNGGKDYVSELENMGTASEGIGAKTKALNQQLKGEGAGLENFNKQIEILSVTAGQTLLPALNDVLGATSELFKWFADLSPETQKNIVKGTALAGVFLLIGGRVASVIETLALLRTAFATTAIAGKTSAATTGTAWGGLAAKAGPLALVAISAAGIATAFYGAKDAGVMSADALRAKWGPLATIWDNTATSLNTIANAAQRIYNSKAFRALERFSPAARIQGMIGRAGANLFATESVDGSHADGLPYVPKDNYKANLHKGEAVLTAKEAAAWRADQRASAPPAASSPDFIRNLYSRYNLASRVDMTCADVAAKTLNRLGYHLKYSANARQLEKNAIAAGWKKVDPRNAPAGALMVGPGSGRSGRHTVVSLGGRRAVSSSNKKISEYNVGQGYAAYVPPGGARGIPATVKEAARAEKERLDAIQRSREAVNRDATAVKERGALLKYESALLRNNALSQEQVNERLEDEGNRRERIKSLTGAGVNINQARQIALIRQEQERANRATEKANALLKEQRAKTLEIIKAGEERMSRRAQETAQMKEYSAALLREQGLLSDNSRTLEEVNQTLEEEAYLRERVAHWSKEGYSNTQAATLAAQDAAQDAAQEKANRSTQKGIDLLRAQRQVFLDAAADAGAAIVQLKTETSRALSETINGLMGDTGLSVETIAQTLGGLKDRIARGELLPGAMPDKKQIASLYGIGEQNDIKAQLDELGSRIGSESEGALSALMAQSGTERTPLQLATENVKQMRLDLEQLQKTANARGIDLSGFVNGFDAQKKALDSILMTWGLVEEKAAQNEKTARLDELKKQLATEQLNLQFKQLDIAGKLTGSKQLELTWQNDVVGKTEEELSTREQILAVMRQIEALAPEDTRVADYIKAVEDRVNLAGILDPMQRELANVQQGLTRDGWTEEMIEAVMPAARLGLEKERALGYINHFLDGTKNSFKSAFDDLYANGPGKFFDNMLGGLRDTLNQMSSEILSSVARDWIAGAIGGAIGGKGGATPGIAGPLGGLAGGFIGGSMNGGFFGGSYATGLDTVPRDMLANIHAGEAVLSLRDAQQWRQNQNDAARAESSSGGNTITITYVHHGDIRTDSPANYQRQLQSKARAPQVSRHEIDRAVALAGARGKRNI